MAVAAMLAITGCSKSGVVGKYRIDMQVPAGQKNDPGMMMASAMLESMSLELKADKTWAMSGMFPLEGTYTVAGDIVELEVTEAMGMKKEDLEKMGGESGSVKVKSGGKPLRLKIVDGGNALEPLDDTPGGSKEDVRFVRQ